MSWVRVTRRRPCPICKRVDWCSVTGDGRLVVCMRVESNRPCKSGGWFHDMGRGEIIDSRAAQSLRRTTMQGAQTPPRDFAKLACHYVEQLLNVAIPAKSFGVSIRSLERLQIGWCGKGHTFPMRDGRERVIGIRIRGARGKWCVPGSRNGLFWPEGVYSGSDYPLVVCEGPTDCAALLDMGYDAIGRPDCSGGVEHVIEFLRGRCRDVVIASDHDEEKHRPDGTTWRPGQDGATRLAREIAPFAKTLKIIKPPFHKDVREWLVAGATREVVDAVIRNVRFVA